MKICPSCKDVSELNKWGICDACQDDEDFSDENEEGCGEWSRRTCYDD